MKTLDDLKKEAAEASEAWTWAKIHIEMMENELGKAYADLPNIAEKEKKAWKRVTDAAAWEVVKPAKLNK